MRQIKPKSSIIYSGPSMIDGKPIVCIAIIKSGNSKTGNMIQTHILRADVNPLEASRTGADVSICGTCQHRGTPHDGSNGKKTATMRSCYVNLGQGPLIVFKGLQRGIYPTATPEQTRAIGAGRMVRLGTYGDPVAVPSRVWNELLSDAEGHTGYTHQHDAEPDYHYLMASADSAADSIRFNAQRIRTFRVIPVSDWTNKGKDSILQHEVLCPASKEAGYKSTCNDCMLCKGSSIKAKSICIVAHGTSRNSVKG